MNIQDQENSYLTLEEMRKALDGKKFSISIDTFPSGDYYLTFIPDDGSKTQFAVVPKDYVFKEGGCGSSQLEPQTSQAIKKWLLTLPKQD